MSVVVTRGASAVAAREAAHQRRVDAHFAVAAPYWQTVYEEDGVDGARYRVRRARALGLAAALGYPRGTRVLDLADVGVPVLRWL